jgi:hypothetical protein
MPYIKENRRVELDNYSDIPRNAGELNYCITKLCLRYIKCLDYQNINDVIGALEAAKLEFYRRLAAPYEDQKIKANGDVY